jgi:hypothetical protein
LGETAAGNEALERVIILDKGLADLKNLVLTSLEAQGKSSLISKIVTT